MRLRGALDHMYTVRIQKAVQLHVPLANISSKFFHTVYDLSSHHCLAVIGSAFPVMEWASDKTRMQLVMPRAVVALFYLCAHFV